MVDRHESRSARRGLSLLEVMLAIAILGGSIAVIGELMRVGVYSAATARDMTTAQLLCESKLAEITSGLVPLQSVGATPFEVTEVSDIESQWTYSILVEPVDNQGLMAVMVTVEQGVPVRPASFSLVRWMIDPDVELTQAQLAAEAEAAASTSATESTTGGTGTSGAGGSGS